METIWHYAEAVTWTAESFKKTDTQKMRNEFTQSGVILNINFEISRFALSERKTC